MVFPLADVVGRLRTPRSATNLPARDPAVQGEKNRVRCPRPRCHVRFVRHDRDEAWPAFSDRTRARERREGLAAEGRLRRRSSPDRDAGASRCPCDACFSTSRAGHPGHACCLRPVDPCDEIPPTRRHRSAVRDPRRWLARIRIHPIRRGRVPPRARARQGGAPA
jgi:hypothetical protein